MVLRLHAPPTDAKGKALCVFYVYVYVYIIIFVIFKVDRITEYQLTKEKYNTNCCS